MQTFEVLCVTMHQHNFSKIDEMNLHSSVVFANQCDRTEYSELKFEGHTAKMISTTTRGVGKNRNLALLYASADICLLADDDVVYVDDMEKKVLDEFACHPDADVMVFYFDSDSSERGLNKYSKTQKSGRFSRSPWGAIRLAFRLRSIQKANAWFTVLLGGGCMFPAGEDSVWIQALRRAGLKFYVSKETIGRVSFENSTWFTGYNEKYYYGVGACYEALNPRTAILKYFYTLFRTRKQSNMSATQKFRWMKNGRRGYRQMLSYNDFVSSKSGEKK